jgi:3-phosphoinositide dependent protein kinase-1
LHSNGIVHRDLKPQNIMLSNEFRLRVIDFGDALIMDDKDKDKFDEDFDSPVVEEIGKIDDSDDIDFKLANFNPYENDDTISPSKKGEYRGTFVGTALYVAPEMIKDCESGPFTDLWALGCIIYQMASGELPFKGKDRFDTFELIRDRKMMWPKNLDSNLKDLIDKMLVVEPLKRLGMGKIGSGYAYTDLMSHPFFEGINWETISKDPVPYDINELRKFIKKKKKKQKFDMSDDEEGKTEGNLSESPVPRQSEVTIDIRRTVDYNNVIGTGTELKRGYLMKRNPYYIHQKRLFILTDEPKLMYFKDEDTFKGDIALDGSTTVSKIKRSKFSIKTKDRTYYLKHPDGSSTDAWVEVIQDAVRAHYG